VSYYTTAHEKQGHIVNSISMKTKAKLLHHNGPHSSNFVSVKLQKPTNEY